MALNFAPFQVAAQAIDNHPRAQVVLAYVREDGAHFFEVGRLMLEQQFGGLRVAHDGTQRLV